MRTMRFHSRALSEYVRQVFNAKSYHYWKYRLKENLVELVDGIENAILIIYKEIFKMKFEIELKDLKKKTNKQNYVLGYLLKQAQDAYKANQLKTFLSQIETYNNYVESIQGKAHNLERIQSIFPNFKYNSDPLANNSAKYLRLMQDLYKVSNDHRPKDTDKGKWIGVEIECIVEGYREFDEDNDEYEEVDQTQTYSELKQEIVKRKIKYVSLKGDGSIECDDSDYVALEFTILTRIDDLSNLEKLCKLLEDKGAKVNSSCGLHIHLDQRDVYTRRFASRSTPERKELSARLMRLNQALPLLTQLVPSSRRNNRYCNTARSKMNNNDRYYAINTDALSKFGTLEIRLHSATTNFIKIKNWIELCYGISRCTKIKNSSKHVITSIEQLKTKYLTEMSLDMVTYFTQRAEKFKGTNEGAEHSEYRNDSNLIVTNVDNTNGLVTFGTIPRVEEFVQRNDSISIGDPVDLFSMSTHIVPARLNGVNATNIIIDEVADLQDLDDLDDEISGDF